MDAFISSFSALCSQLMPILIATVLVVLIVLLIKIIKVVTSLNNTLNSTSTTIGLVDQSLLKVQAPLDSAVKIAHTVDKAHDATLETINNTKEFVSENAKIIKEKVSQFVQESQQTDAQQATAFDEDKQPEAKDMVGEENHD